ncbi:MAG: proton-conducting transporter membrane subunit, partial [Buchnera aphidicola]|nr:proton-conducting transporter membrane subunit [Buchnera aphidicola]
GWLSDVYVYSPRCGSVDIVGVLLKTAPYALLRYNFGIFPHATRCFSYIAIILGVFSVFYGYLVSFSQNNIKRIISYSSIAHMGLILIAIYSMNAVALQGAIIQILSSSISTTALCILSGQLYKYFNTQKIS